MTVSYEEFKKNELLVGAVKSFAGGKAIVDFGPSGAVECNIGDIKVGAGDVVIGVLSGGKARLLAVQDKNNKFSLLTTDSEVVPGTRVE